MCVCVCVCLGRCVSVMCVCVGGGGGGGLSPTTRLWVDTSQANLRQFNYVAVSLKWSYRSWQPESFCQVADWH